MRFFVALAERANDRLPIAAFVDYRDMRNLIPLALAALSTIAVFASLWWGDGTPVPNPAKSALFEQFRSDAEDSLKNILDDLRRWTPANGEARDQKQRALIWASRFALFAIIATAVVKTMELR